VGLALIVTVVLTCGADSGSTTGAGDLDELGFQARRLAVKAVAWYESTAPADRMTWGGLAASAALGLGVLFERMLRLRQTRIIPDEFMARFLTRLIEGKLDRGKALDYCELNPSPASRVALAAVRRWGRPVSDLERAVTLTRRVETERLRRNVGTLRRIAALSPLIGLLGTLVASGRALAALGPADGNSAWGPALAGALGPLTTGVAIAILALVAYDGLAGRVETLEGALDRVGAETIDAIALARPFDLRPATPGTGASARTPHQVRLEFPNPGPRPTVEHQDELERGD
jgi:biopolymer transport protein ExbB